MAASEAFLEETVDEMTQIRPAWDNYSLCTPSGPSPGTISVSLPTPTLGLPSWC